MEICWIVPESRFQCGQKIQVLTRANMRNSAGYLLKPDTDVLTVLKPGAIVTVGNGSVDCDALTWWYVKDENNQWGWVAETDQYGTALLGEYDDTDWGRSIAFVLSAEGGLSTDPGDPGNYVNEVFKGTKYGISAASFPELDIPNLTVEQAKAIYFIDYWKASRADELPWPLCLTHFDFAVNAGVGQANKTLSQSDYNFERYNELRRQFYRSLSQFDRYGVAWLNRVSNLEKYVQQIKRRMNV